MSDKTNEELADWLESYADFYYSADDTKAALMEAAARLRQQSEDSARYRLLRSWVEDQTKPTGANWVSIGQDDFGSIVIEGESIYAISDDLSDAIDKARKS